MLIFAVVFAVLPALRIGNKITVVNLATMEDTKEQYSLVTIIFVERGDKLPSLRLTTIFFCSHSGKTNQRTQSFLPPQKPHM